MPVEVTPVRRSSVEESLHWVSGEDRKNLIFKGERVRSHRGSQDPYTSQDTVSHCCGDRHKMKFTPFTLMTTSLF
jgi:hypothetical protein